MTVAEPGAATTRAQSICADLTAAVVASWIWGACTAARLDGAERASLWLAAAGAAAVTLGPLVVIIRGARPFPEAMRVVVFGALLASAPVAELGALLRGHTHHRALGAVTFAVIAAGMVAFGAAVARRLRYASAGSAAWRVSATFLYTASGVSSGLVLALALTSAAHAGAARDLVVDAAQGALFAALAVIRPKAGPRAALACLGAALYGVTVVAGLAVLSQSVHVLSALRERAPAALGALGALTGVGYR